MVVYYDVVLGLIPASLIGITAVLGFTGIPINSAVPIAGLFATLLIGHALFVNSPAHQSHPEASASIVTEVH